MGETFAGYEEADLARRSRVKLPVDQAENRL